jgi:hypothetical protein
MYWIAHLIRNPLEVIKIKNAYGELLAGSTIWIEPQFIYAYGRVAWLDLCLEERDALIGGGLRGERGGWATGGRRSG